MASGKLGRPSKYTPEIAEEICERLMEGESLRAICRGDDMPHYITVLRWMERDEAFATKCAHARVIQADAIHDDIADIEDRTLIGQIAPDVARVVLSSKQWRAAKLAPKKYSERHQLEHGVSETLEDLLLAGQQRQ